MSFRISTQGLARLMDADIDLARDVRWAIGVSTVDFSVYEVRRELERQKQLVASGASRTLDSYHLADAAGVSHATDLVPLIAGKLQWQAAPCNEVARAMWLAAKKFKSPTTWGAVWDRKLVELDPNELDAEIDAYIARWRAAHARPPAHVGYWGPLIDRPHFQVPRS